MIIAQVSHFYLPQDDKSNTTDWWFRSWLGEWNFRLEWFAAEYLQTSSAIHFAADVTLVRLVTEEIKGKRERLPVLN